MSGLLISVIIGVVIGLTIYQRKGQRAAEPRPEEEVPVRAARPVTRAAYDSPREIREAIDAGEQALSSLRAAKEKLDSARMWGVADLLGGGLITSLVKHNSVQSANQLMEAANRDLRHFARELEDVSGEAFHVQTGDLVTFLDIFCDNFFSDFLMQNRINDARARMDQVIERVQNTLWDLKAMESGSGSYASAYAAAAGTLPTLGASEERPEYEDSASGRAARRL